MFRDSQRRRRARLPWAELEAEAQRQGCSPADIFFDRAGRVATVEQTPAGPRLETDGEAPANHARPTSDKRAGTA